MQIRRHAIVVIAAIWTASTAYAQGELSEPANSFVTTDDRSDLVGEESLSGDFFTDELSAEWSDSELPQLLKDETVEESSASFGSWFGGVELVRLKPSYSHGTSTPPYSLNNLLWAYGDQGTFSDDPDDALRALVGWESASGLGVRGRFWEYENGGVIDPDYQFSPDWRIDATRFDLDVYRRFQFHRGSIAAGANLATVDLNIDGFRPGNASYDATGLGVFVDGRHTLYESDRVAFALIGRGRWSQLMGKHSYDTTVYDLAINPDFYDVYEVPTVVQVRDDADLQIAEAAAGLEVVRKFRHAALALQCAVEVQNWRLNAGDELSFVGSTFSVGLQY
jgi:hypothetical protein